MKGIPSLWPELWLHIFSYLPNLDLLHATLTHRFFCELVQPLLFREAYLYLPTIANGGRPGMTAVDNSASQRLHTISSPRIAHAVRKLTLRSTSYTTALLSHEYQTLCHYQSTIQMIVELLPCFTALSTLACDKLRWSTCLFEDLAAIKQLRVLELKDCLLDIDRGGVLNRLNVNILTLESSDLERFPVKGWDSVINAHCTNYSVGGAQSFSLASLSARPEILPSLHSLNTNVYDEYLTLSMVLGKSSHTLRTLCVNFRADSELVPLLSSSPHWPILPLLSSYTGPVALLSLLTTTELLNNIRHLDLRDRQRDALHFHSIQSPEVLSRFNRSESLLETLILPTSAITQDHLETIFSCNPYLRHLTIWDYGWREWDSDPLSLEGIFTALSTMSLSQDITTIELCLRLSEFLDEQKCCLLRENLQKKYWYFNRLVINCRGQFVWQREDNVDRFICEYGNIQCIDESCPHRAAPVPMLLGAYDVRARRKSTVFNRFFDSLKRMTERAIDLIVAH